MPSGDDLPSFEAFARESLGWGDPEWIPYPWQVRFAERWADPDASPPAWVIAPTGSGKTAVLDALVWALARQADLAPAERTATTRIVWAIDRRMLVDEVHEHAIALAERLERALDAGPAADALHGVARRLYRLACIGREAAPDREERRRLGLRPLAVQRWRGGIAKREQLLSPFQPQIIASTVAQIGSRLLFRGYGLGERSLQVGAGLAAVDTTVCLDEAHLAAPFQETVGAISAWREKEPLRLPPFHLLTLTATPPEAVDEERAVGIEKADRVRLGKRWNGKKTLELRDEEGTKPEQSMVAAVEEFLADGSRVVACVVNQVRLAGSVHRVLEKKLGDSAKVVLLIGPQRPVDREKELAAVRRPLLEGEKPELPVVVVATQTIEVGLDADFDAMVTQSASASALVQRLGRLNRSGARPGHCIVVRDQKSPLYEEDEPGAWGWLVSRPGAPAEIDVSVAALDDPDGRPPPDRQQARAATLTDAAVAQLIQTSPRPAPFADPDIEPLLRGIDADRRGDVQIIWRDDLRFALDEDGDVRGRLTGYRGALLRLAQPEAREMLPRTIAGAKQLLGTWLTNPEWIEKWKPASGEGADIEGGDESEERWREMPLAPFLVVRGREILHGSAESNQAETTIALIDIAPGDTVVVPTTLLRSDGAVFPGPTWNVDDAMADRDRPPDSEPESSGEPGETRFRLRVSWEALMPTRRTELIKAPTPADEGALKKQWEMWCKIADRLNKLDLSATEDQHFPAEHVSKLLGSELKWAAPMLDAWLTRVANEESAVRIRRVTPQPSREELAELDAADTEADETVIGEVEPQDDQPAVNDSRASKRRAKSLLELDLRAGQVWVLSNGRGADAESDGSPPTLEEHSLAVHKRARRFVAPLGLPDSERQAIELAALGHDVGKLDGRFQGFLANGAAIRHAALAKSAFGSANPVAAAAAAEQAGLPRRFMHEAASVEAVAAALHAGTIPAHLADADPQLTLGAIAGHHGRGSPLWRVEEGGLPAVAFEVDLLGIRGTASGSNRGAWLGGKWFEMFFDLRRRYGPWAVAYLQALVALADRTVSQEGS